MSKSTDHFRYRDLRPALLANGWASRVTELELMEKQIRELAKKRRALLQEYLADVIYNHEAGVCKIAFRPCHLKRLDELEISTDFLLV